MHSTRGAFADNPWSEFCCHRDARDSGRDSGREASEGTSAGGPQDFERFLSNRLPVSFSGAQHVIRCGICGVLVVRGRYKEHHDNRHNLCNSKKNMIPFEADFLHNDKIYKGKKIKRSKKKRSNVKEKAECSNEIINKKKSKKMKVKSTNKRLHSKSLFDEIDYINKKKKLKCDFIDDSEDIKQFEQRNEEDFLSSPKQIEDNFYQDKINITKTYNPLSINDGLCYSNDSVHRTSSDSSTPPSLSLGTLQTLSSPSSLNILNDLSSVITEHYLLPSNDLSTERLGVSCKYQIDSLPWENLPPISNKMYNNGSFYSLKDKELCSNIPIAEEDGEIERAVQSITGFYECLADEFEITNQMSLDEMTSCDGSKSAISKLENISNEDNNSDIKCSDMLTGDDGAVLDCFLDEMDNHSNNDKDPLSESCNDANNNSEQNNSEINRNVVDIFMDECNNMSEYQIDSNLLNIFNSDYEEKFETLINNAMNEFVTQSPQNVSLEHSKCDRKKHSSKVIQARNFDPLKHCGVVGANGQFCYRSLLCKLHTMPQKRQVERSENITSLIKGIRDCNKIKKMNKKSSQQPADSRSSCSKISCDSFIYNCSSSKGSEEISSLLENNLSFTDTEENIFNSSDTCFVNNPVIISGQEPQPLAVPRFDREVIVNCNRPFLAMKSLVWKNRPRSYCDPELLGRFLSNQTEYQSKFTPNKHTDSCFSDSLIDPEDVFNQQSLSAGAVGKSVLTVGTNVSHLPSPRNLTVCSSQMVNINSQHSTPVDRIVTDSIINNVVSLSDPGSCSTMINPSPQNTSLWNPVLATEPVFSNNKFISITDDRTSGAQMLYPVRNNGQIMMVMNKGHKLLNDQVDLTNENFSFSVNQSIPINSLLTLKQQNSNSISSQSRNVHIQQQPQQQQQHQSTAVPTQQIVSLSPLELQKLTDGLCSSNGQIISTECVNKSNEIFINPSKTNEKKNQILYQLNQSQSSNQFLSSTISSKLDSNNLPKPLTVQSSTPNGITHRFVILPDGTISAFTQQSNNLKTNLNQSQAQQQQSSQQQSQHQSQQPQIINRTTLQHPLFGQLSNCGQNQSCFLNGDKLIITPNQVATNTLSQQIIMPQIINQTDLNSQPASRFTLVHQQQKLGTNPKTNYNRLQSQHSVSTQLPIESPHQKLSFHIQTPNQYQNHTPNTFFLTTTPSGNSSVPLKQQIFLQSNDQMTSDFSLIDSNKFIDGQQYNAQGKLVHHFDNLQCNSDVHTITPSSQDFDFLNHVMNPQPIIIQQPPVNRTSLNQSLSHLSNPNVVQNNFITQTSQDINIGIDGAHSNMSTNGGSNTSNTNSNHNNTTNSSCNNANNNSNNNSNNNNCNSNNSNSSISSSNSNNNNNNQHIVINNNSNEKFAQSSQLTLSQRQLSATFSNTSNCSSVVVNQNQQNFKSVPPPLVISQQLLGQSVSNHFGNKPFLDISYQQQSQQKNSHLNQITLDENQFSNEFVIMQSMIA